MFKDYFFTVKERFLRYVQIDTQSDPDSKTVPSTEKQKTLGQLLVDELRSTGIVDAAMDHNGYVYATIPASSQKSVPVICFCAHMDTSPDCSGAGVVPIVHQNYDGGDLILPDDITQTIRPGDHPYLLTKIGEDIITASGSTLLGADDKAGIAIIMDMANFMITHPEIPHGEIKILFTPDEEIGRGVDHVDLKRLAADYAYTLDGGELGSFEDETFSADAFTVRFTGIAAHPGDAKNRMINAIKLASFFVDRIPKDHLSPETSSGREGFVHPVRTAGTAEESQVEFIIRDFDTAKLDDYVTMLIERANEVISRFPGSGVSFERKFQYRNMKEVLDLHPQLSEFAKMAIGKAGVPVLCKAARGGTDGSRLSFMGLPCPNIFTGEMAFHSRQEYVSVQDMQKSVQTIIHLAMIWEERS